MYTDRTITCLDCGGEFAFTAGEQEFYAERGFTEAPKRCPSCRAQRKAQRAAQAGLAVAGGTDAAGIGYGASYAAPPRSYAPEARERRPREMFEAVCADCGATASVPFKPLGIKPVYCRDCFQGRR